MTPAAAHAGLMRAVVHDRFDKLPPGRGRRHPSYPPDGVVMESLMKLAGLSEDGSGAGGSTLIHP